MLNRLKLGTKLIIAFTLVVSMTVIIGVMSARTMNAMKAGEDLIYKDNMKAVEELGTLNEALASMQAVDRGVSTRRLFNKREFREETFALNEEKEKAAETAWTHYMKIGHDGEDETMNEAFKAAWDEWMEHHDGHIILAKKKSELLDAGVPDVDPRITKLDADMFATLLKTESTYAEVEKNVEALTQKNINNAEAADEQFDADSGAARNMMILIVAVGVLIGLGCAFYFIINLNGIIRSLLSETRKLSDAAVAGQLATRGDPEKINFEFRGIVTGMNDTLDAVIGPLNVAAEYVDRISNGDTPEKITGEYKGDFNKIKNSLNKCIDEIGILVHEVGVVFDGALEGRLRQRSNADQTRGVYRKILRGINDTLDSLVGHIDSMPAPALIVDNDLTIQYMNKTGADIIGLNQQQIIGTKCFNHFKTSDCNTERCACARAIRDGRISSSETDAHPGGKNLDIAYTGVPIKDSDGKVIGALEIVTDMTAVKHAARLSAKVSEYQASEVAKLVDSLGKMAHGNLNFEMNVAEGDKDTDETRKTFEKIVVALNATVNAIKQLVADTVTLSQAAVEGKLKTRADAAKHQGDFQKIVRGVNDTLDSVILPVNEAAEILKLVAHNDMTKLVKGDYKGDHAKIKESLNTAITNLNSVLSQVVESVSQVEVASQQISSSAQGVAERTSEQASSLEEISSSLEEMSSMTKRNAENAAQARLLSMSANDSAEKGKTAMERMNAAIEDIKNSSDKTAKIVKTIDEIAFQTNLLALNAAVEAARAGEAGKGFAVVAEEVRNLAMRSAEAAKETAKMIEESVKNSENGVKIADEVGKSLFEIADGAGRVNNLVAEIAAASKEQSQGIEQVNIAMGQMDKVTQANASSAEEAASASEELSSQANHLSDMVTRFKVSRNGKEDAETLVGLDMAVLRQMVSQAKAHKNALGGNGHEYKKRPVMAGAENLKSRFGDGMKPSDIIPMDEDLSEF